jgi:hypothetical protein
MTTERTKEEVAYMAVNPTTTCPLCGEKGGIAWHEDGNGCRCSVCRATIQWGTGPHHKVPVLWAQEKMPYPNMPHTGSPWQSDDD